MAKLYAVGPYVGRNERRTAESLAAALPESWVVVANYKLPRRDRDDVDLVVCGDSVVFAVEEKSWGPRVTIGEQLWRTSNGDLVDPSNNTNFKARVLAGYFRDRVPGFVEHVGKRRHVLAVVVLSHQRLQLVGAGRNDAIVLPLEDASRRLTEEDQRLPRLPDSVRERIIKILVGQQHHDRRPATLGSYKVDTELPSIGRCRVFSGHSILDANVVLRCYPINGWGVDVEPGQLLEREARTLHRLESLNSQGRAHTPFFEPLYDWFVTPYAVPDGEQALCSMTPGATGTAPQRPTRDELIQVATNSFAVLSEVHKQGVLHRALCPERIKVDRNFRVRFDGYFLSRISDDKTIPVELVDDPPSQCFRAPECATNLHAAIEPSDVYSLGLSLAAWALGVDPSRADSSRIELELTALGDIGELLGRLIQSRASNRPSASDALEELQSLSSRQATVGVPVAAHETVVVAEEPWKVSTRVKERYQLVRLLGRGIDAETWLARDVTVGTQEVVVKRYLTELAAKHSRAQADRLFSVRHPSCGNLLAFDPLPPFGFRVSEFVLGVDLAEFAKRRDRQEASYLKVIRCLLEALDYLHGKGLVHRDVTPSNIVVRPDESACLIDLDSCDRSGSTGVVTTPRFCAPELLRGEAYSPASDLFSLGASFRRVLGPVRADTSLLERLVRRLEHEELEGRFKSASAALRWLDEAEQKERPVVASPSVQPRIVVTPKPPPPPALEVSAVAVPVAKPAVQRPTAKSLATKSTAFTRWLTIVGASAVVLGGLVIVKGQFGGNGSGPTRAVVEPQETVHVPVVSTNPRPTVGTVEVLGSARATELSTTTSFVGVVKPATSMSPQAVPNLQTTTTTSPVRTSTTTSTLLPPATAPRPPIGTAQVSLLSGLAPPVQSPFWGVGLSPDRSQMFVGAASGIAVSSSPFSQWRTFQSSSHASLHYAWGAWSHDGRYLAASTDEGWVVSWDVATGNEISAFQTVGGRANIDWSPSGYLIAESDYGGGIGVWDASTGVPVWQQNLYSSYTYFTAVKWSPDGRTIAASSHNGQLRFLDPSSGALTQPLVVFAVQIDSISWSPDASRIAATSQGLRLYVIARGSGQRSQISLTSSVAVVRWRPDGTSLAVGYQSGGVQLVAPSTGGSLSNVWSTSTIGGGAIRALDWSSDGRSLVVGTASHLGLLGLISV